MKIAPKTYKIGLSVSLSSFTIMNSQKYEHILSKT